MEDSDKNIAKFLYELGTMRKLPRMHGQTFLSSDLTDNIASHSFRVPFIGWMIAKGEGLDPYKVAMMSLIHDLGEARSGDHNWVHKRYVKIEEDQIVEEQLGSLPYGDLFALAKEYRARTCQEAIAAKDADLIDQILLMHEYAHQGNTEALRWIEGDRKQVRLDALKLLTSKKIAEAIFETKVYEWWKDLYTNINK